MTLARPLGALIPAFTFAVALVVGNVAFGINYTCNSNQTDNGVDYCYGGSGAENVDLKGGDDLMFGYGGGDTGRGGQDKDELNGGSGPDHMVGGPDRDRRSDQPGFLLGVGGDEGGDELQGGTGEDWVIGGSRVDDMYGEEDDDVVYADERGSNADDTTINGGGGTDFCYVNSGEGGAVSNCDGNVYYNYFQ